MSEIRWSRRIARAIYIALLNAIVWVLIPSLFSNFYSSRIPTINLSGNFIFTFGLIITALQVIGALTGGMLISVPFTTGSYVASAYYTWSILNGGMISVDYLTYHVELEFPLLVYLLMLPSLFNIVRTPLSYLLEESEGAKPAKDLP